MRTNLQFCQRLGSSEQSLEQYRKVEMFQEKQSTLPTTLPTCKYSIQTHEFLYAVLTVQRFNSETF